MKVVSIVSSVKGRAGITTPAKPLPTAEDSYNFLPSSDQQQGPPSHNTRRGRMWLSVTKVDDDDDDDDNGKDLPKKLSPTKLQSPTPPPLRHDGNTVQPPAEN